MAETIKHIRRKALGSINIYKGDLRCPKENALEPNLNVQCLPPLQKKNTNSSPHAKKRTKIGHPNELPTHLLS